MSSIKGRYFPLSLPRRWIGDLLHFAKQVPSVPVERVMDLSAIKARRARVSVSWPALFLRAFGLTAQKHPELRQSILRYPWTRCYEHPCSVASVALEREYQGEPAVFFGQIMAPELHELTSIDKHLKRYKNEPIDKFPHFRRVIWLSRFPQFLRRFGWWISLHWIGEKRSKRLGTFGLSVYSGLGASSTHPLSPVSYLLNYGVMDERGRITVRLIYDHRIVDGALIARALATMESIFNGPILEELDSLEADQSAGKDHSKDDHDTSIAGRSESLVS
jgi:hypothetical protein